MKTRTQLEAAFPRRHREPRQILRRTSESLAFLLVEFAYPNSNIRRTAKNCSGYYAPVRNGVRKGGTEQGAGNGISVENTIVRRYLA